MKITIEASTDDRAMLLQILRDAVGEFIDRRTPSDEYVRARYAEQPESFRRDKLGEVRHRTDIAETIEFDTDDAPDDRWSYYCNRCGSKLDDRTCEKCGELNAARPDTYSEGERPLDPS
jgi:hypothetical protein